ncbi:MAG TPA: ferredoxin reductase family protein [Euzebyales bacterium]|nr:ferredoxin reductase family protein [Euzebyales bacterium]
MARSELHTRDAGGHVAGGRPADPLAAWLAVALPALPVLLLRVIPDLGAVNAGLPTGLRLAAVHAGVFGYVAFATSLVLGARFPAVERLFAGLDRMYRFHRRLGVTVAGLLVLHALLMVAAVAAEDGGRVATLLLPDPGWRVFTGVLGLGALAMLLVLTTVAHLRHETFLRVHRLLGVVFVAGALHALRVPAFQAQSPWLNGYLAAVTVAGLVAWGYRSGLGRSLVRRHFYEVSRVRTLHPTITELTLTPLEEPLAFAPGQLVFVGLDDEAVTRELHPFSITSAPGERDLRLVIKAAGDFTSELHGVTPGSLCKVEGPYGGFWRAGSRAARQVWIAGGIGITPFLSMARSLPDDVGAIDLYYCTEDADAAVLIDELYAVADRHPTVRVIPVPADSLGFLRADDVRAVSGDLSATHVFLCGPAAMIDALTAQLRALGVPDGHLHHEDFRLRGRAAARPTPGRSAR